ncbi:HK97-gp10 family putative phage morphogenesis protein [Mesorhizobium sp. ASY16-5R]|uniref:HK97-gp10 family putative phage morphogenesis protein n=1 Tax=Mesorhizobium sp. ASY16-5R TaxID=3445772 RepID=UPI003FA158AD
MANSGASRVVGLDEINRALDKLKKSTATGVLNRVLKKAAKPIADKARNNAPRDTGELKKSIKVEVVRSNAGKSAFASVMRDGGTRDDAAEAARAANRFAAGQGASAKVRVRAAARHAHLVEFGTVKMERQPFLLPAFRAGEKPAYASIRQDLLNEIEKTVQRIAVRQAKRK